ncbi:MAG: esterase-like activity of phytase family protein [Myxococcales bacterium]|nr:MAG: esterase-like activity of phytase family protein [Myxococcales bacterium]
MALALVACVGCTKKEPRGPGRVVSLQTDVVGLSGLTRDEHGALWVAGEDADAVLRIDPETFGVTRYPVVGAPEGTDLEAMTWVDGTRFVIGTETQDKGRTRDVVLDGRLEGEQFKVSPIGHLEYAHWGLTAPDNHGMEGICHVDGILVVATELIEEARDRRWAPLATFDPKIQTWTAHRIALTSKTGKLAALDCRKVDGAIEALAVERHYGESRLLRFRVPQGTEGQWIEPTVAADVSKLVSPLPNFEGLAWLADGSAVLVADNQYKGAALGPSRLYFIPASAMQ